MVGLNVYSHWGTTPSAAPEDAWRIVLGDPNDKRVQYTVTDPAVNLPESSPPGTGPMQMERWDITFYPKCAALCRTR